MGKNDVEILVKARDAVGPGLDSARNNLKRFGQDVDRTIGQSFVEKTGKALMGIQGIAGGLALFSGALKSMNGDSQALADSLERLPLGLGNIAREIREIVNELSGFNAEVEKTKRDNDLNKRMQELIQKRRDLESNPDDVAIRKIRSGATGEAARDEAELNKLNAAINESRRRLSVFENPDLRTQQQFGQGRIAEIVKEEQAKLNELLNLQKTYDNLHKTARETAEAEAAMVRKKARDRELKEEADHQRKLRDEMVKQAKEDFSRVAGQGVGRLFLNAARFVGGDIIDPMAKKLADDQETVRRLIREQDMEDANRRVIPRNRFQEIFADDIAQRDEDAILQRMRMLSGGAGGLPSGASDRFGTGLVAAAADRQAAETTKQTKLLEDIREELKQANEPNADGAQIILNGGGIFGGLS